MDASYFLKFPSVLKKVLQDKTVTFPKELQQEYKPIHVFRGIRYVIGEKEEIDKTDFLSQAERNLPGTDFEDIGSYSCSCFEDVEELVLAYQLPRKNKCISDGMMKCELGPLWNDLDDEWETHRHWFLYENVDPSNDFKVYEYDYEKVDTSK